MTSVPFTKSGTGGWTPHLPSLLSALDACCGNGVEQPEILQDCPAKPCDRPARSLAEQEVAVAGGASLHVVARPWRSACDVIDDWGAKLQPSARRLPGLEAQETVERVVSTYKTRIDTGTEVSYVPRDPPGSFWSILVWNVRVSVSCQGEAESRVLCVLLSDAAAAEEEDEYDGLEDFWTCSDVRPEGSYASGVFPVEHLGDNLVFRARLMRMSPHAVLQEKTLAFNKSAAYDPDLHCFGPLPSFSGCAFQTV